MNLIEQLNTQGYGIIPSYLTPQELRAVQAAYLSTVNQQPIQEPKRIWNLMTNHALLNLAQPKEQSILHNTLEHMLGHHYLLAGSYSNTIYPGRHPGHVHQDYPFNVLSKRRQMAGTGPSGTGTAGVAAASPSRSTIGPTTTAATTATTATATTATTTSSSTPRHCETINIPKNHEITTLLCLDDFTISNGATEILPRSHLYPLGTELSTEMFESKAVQLLGRKGDLIVFHGALFHRSGSNSTNQKRTGILSMYLQESQRPQIDPWKGIPERVKQTLGKRARLMLGAEWHAFDEAQLNKRKKHEKEEEEEEEDQTTTDQTSNTKHDKR